MSNSRWTPSKGREIEDMIDKLNELITAVNKQSSRATNKTEKKQNINVVETGDGHALQIRTKDGIIQSDPTYVTGFRKI